LGKSALLHGLCALLYIFSGSHDCMNCRLWPKRAVLIQRKIGLSPAYLWPSSARWQPFFGWDAARHRANSKRFGNPCSATTRRFRSAFGQPTRLYRLTGPRTEELNHLLGGGSASRDRNSSKLPLDSDELAWVAPEYLFMRDALSAFNVASWIQSKGRPYQLMSAANINYSQLRHTPLVAIGAFNNPWAMRVTAELRFVFEARTVGGTPHNFIVDRRNPNAAGWKVIQPNGGPVAEDYAIVTKVFDPATEKTVITAAVSTPLERSRQASLSPRLNMSAPRSRQRRQTGATRTSNSSWARK
jgi:hypothetical protein